MLASDFSRPDQHRGPLGTAIYWMVFWLLIYPLSRILMLFHWWPPYPSLDKPRAHFGDYQPGASDVLVCSYFKSGTTWLLQIVTQIAWKGRAEFDSMFSVAPWPDGPPVMRSMLIPLSNPSPAQLSPTGLRAIKTHLNAGLVPWRAEARYIAMTRDPKAVAVSGYHFFKAAAFGPSMPPFWNWVAQFTTRRFFIGSWAVHLSSYWSRRDEPNVLFLNYEELRGNPAQGIDRIAAFMGVTLTEEARAAVIERSSFAAMKQQESKFEPPTLYPWAVPEGAMVRKGGSGGRDPLMTPEYARRIDDFSRAELQSLGCDFDYDEAYTKVQ
ncbi:MAG: sulfotransferase domain-containing protein [Novosphingobium sp.]